MKKLLLAAILLLTGSTAFAQSVQQSGSVTPGHATRWFTNGVVGDGGTAASGNLTSLGVTASGPGICQNSGPITGPYNALCLGVTQTGGGQISVFNHAGATGGFTLSLNGTPQGFVTVGLPTVAGDLVTFLNTTGQLVDSGVSVNTILNSNTSYKSPVKLASTANLTLSGEQTIDGALTSATRVLAKNQTVQTQNGCYVTAAGAWTRCSDFVGTQLVDGTQVLVTNGTRNAGKLFRVNTPNPITVGTTALVFSQRNVVANIQDFGGRSDESTDNGPACIAAMNSLALDTGGTIVFPASPNLSSNYLFTSECTIPKFSGTAFVRVVGYGANLGTRSASALRIFNRQPADITDALNIVGARFSFEGMTIFGNLVTGQVGIWLGATYTSIIKDATFWNLDVGFDGVFCLACKVENVHGQTNKTVAIRFESGLGNFTGGSTLNSASNDCIIDNTRDFVRAGAASYQIWGADGCAIEHSVSEGGDPINDVDFDTQGSGVVRSFKVDTMHVENSPTTAHFKVQGGGGPGVYSFKNIVDQSGSVSLMIDASTMAGTQATIVAADIPVPFAGAYFSTPGLADVHWQFNNIGGGTIDLASPTFWAGGVVPFTMKQDDFSSSQSAPQTYFPYRYYLGSSLLPVNDTSGLYSFGNIFGATDDTQSLGTNSALSTTARLKYVMTGPTGGFLGYNGASLYLGTAIPAGGVTGTGLKFSSTANYGLFFSSGTPTLSAARGSLAITDNGAPYYNNNGTTGWTQLGTGGWHTLKQVNVEQTVVTGPATKGVSFTMTVPGGTVSATGRLRVTPQFQFSGAAGTRQSGLDYGGTTFATTSSSTGTTILSQTVTQWGFINRNSTSAQIAMPVENSSNGLGTGTTVFVTGSVDTTANQTLTLWFTLAGTDDTGAVESVLVEYNNDNP